MTGSSICFILPGWLTRFHGGAEWQTYLISEEFIKRQWRVAVITAGPKRIHLQNKFFNPKIRYFYYPETISRLLQFIIAFYSVLFLPAAYYYIRTDNSIFRSACTLVCRFTRSKVIYAIAGDDELEYNEFRINKNLSPILKLLRSIDFTMINIITRRSEHRVNLIIVQTNYQQKILKEKKGLESIVVRNSFVFGNENYNVNKKEDLILWIGNFRPVKQPELFIKLIKECDLKNVKFVMIGNTNNYQFDLLPDNLNLTGPLQKTEVNEYFQRAKVLVNTSITEGFSNTFLEAWANFVYVVSLNANPDNLLNGDLGYCANGDIGVLALKLKKCISEQKNKYKKVYNSFSSIALEFNLQSNVSKLIKEIEIIR